MNVLFAAAEMSPLVKVGGLGDVAGSLPRALRAGGTDVRVALPFYASIDRTKRKFERVTGVAVPHAGATKRAVIWRTDVGRVPVYLVECAAFFGRDRVYGYDDDIDRFLFFCDALIAAAPKLGFTPDLVHAQDWHTALLLTRLAGNAAHEWASAARVYTIHNLPMQGRFTRAWAKRQRIAPARLAPPDALERDVALSCMAQGILHADRVNTVSDTYAKEILTPEFGAGLDALLRMRAHAVSGIVNGIDETEFDPAKDRALVRRYDPGSLDLRIENKRVLQEQAGLPQRDGAMLFGIVTRLFAQKGIDLVPEAFDEILASRDAQLVVLGTGDENVHTMLQRLEAKYAERVKVWLDFNPKLGQRIYAGCDCFLMPSRYEPCGLGQLISLRYGAVPLVRRTGGLADTVEDANDALTTGTGFVFEDANAHELRQACERALRAFGNHEGWKSIQLRGMQQDWSWKRAAPLYARLYDDALAARAESVA